MGAGKSTVGRLLSRTLGWPLIDIDSEIEGAAGRTVAELFAVVGEPAFRVLETEAIERVIADDAPAVVAVGGGAVLAAANRQLLRGGGTVVWLRASLETLGRRVGDGAGRPLLSGAPSERLARIEAERRSLYEEVATVVVDVDDLSPEAVAEKVLATLP